MRNNYSNYLIISIYNTCEKRRYIWRSILLLFGKQDWWLQTLKDPGVRTEFKSDPLKNRIRIVISANYYNKEETQYQRKYPDDENWDFSNFLRIGYHNHQSCGSGFGRFRVYWTDLLFLFLFFWSVELGQLIIEVKDLKVGSGSGFLKCRIQINNLTPDIYFFIFLSNHFLLP